MKNKTNALQFKILTGISFVLILIPGLWLLLWVYCFNTENNQPERLKKFQRYFPESLNEPYTISSIALLLCIAGIILSAIYFQRRTSSLKTINTIILVAGIVMAMLLLFSLM